MFKNVIANFVGRFWSILSNFIFIPLYINLLGFESYSLISFSLIIAGVMAVLDAGFSATLSRELARADLNSTEKNRIFGTLETIYLIITIIAIAFVFFASNAIASDWVSSKTYNSKEISVFVKIISFDIGFQLLIRFYLGGFLGLEQQIKSNALQVAWGVTRNGLVVLVLFFVPTLILFFAWQAASTFVFALVAGLLLRKEINRKFSFSIRRIEKDVLLRIWKFAGGMLLISIVAAFNTQMDKIIISKLLPLESLGYYTLAVSLSMGIVVIVNPISVAILPRLTSYFTGNRIADAEQIFRKVNLGVSILVFSILAIMIYFSHELVFIWTGDRTLALKVSPFLPIIAFAVSMLSLATIPYNIAIANGYTKLNNLLGVISLLITLPGYWLATNRYGAIGAAYVFCTVQFFITIIYIYLINKKYFGLNNLKKLFLRPLFLPLFLCLGIGYIFSFMPEFFKTDRFFSLVWIVTSIFFTFCISLLILVSRFELIQIIKQLKFTKKLT
jgi:O-antigen/teichoic acid export membrane protein